MNQIYNFYKAVLITCILLVPSFSSISFKAPSTSFTQHKCRLLITRSTLIQQSFWWNIKTFNNVNLFLQTNRSYGSNDRSHTGSHFHDFSSPGNTPDFLSRKVLTIAIKIQIITNEYSSTLNTVYKHDPTWSRSTVRNNLRDTFTFKRWHIDQSARVVT